MIQIPTQSKVFNQPNNSDNEGNIWSSLNLELTYNQGRLQVSPRGIITSNSTDLVDMTTPVSFKFYDGKIWAIAGKMYSNAGNPSDPFVLDALSNTPVVSNDADMALFNGSLYVIATGENKIKKLNGSTWTTVGSYAGGGSSCCVYGGRLYFSLLSSQIASIDLNDAVSYSSGSPNTVESTLQLADFGAGGSNANEITCIRASSNRIWIATTDSTSNTTSAGRGGKIFEWDGSITQTNKVYNLESVGALTIIIKNDIPFVVDADGKLLQFNGSSFVEVALLPIPKNKYLKNPLGTSGVDRFIHPNGAILKDDKILMLINNAPRSTNDDLIENIPSGIWEYDNKVGLYHKNSCSLFKYNTHTNDTRPDFSQNRLSEVGALFNAKSVSTDYLEGDMIWGAKYYTNATSTKYGFFVNNTSDTYNKVGYLVTPKFDSSEITDIWQDIWIKHKKLLDSSDRIVLKYRTSDIPPTEAEIYWIDTFSFNTSQDLSEYAPGDEVEITQGTGGGQIEHIDTISSTGGAYVVTFTNEFKNVSDTAKARFQKWILIGEQTSQYDENIVFPVNVSSNWIQVKCVIYFTGNDELNALQIINDTYIKSQ